MQEKDNFVKRLKLAWQQIFEGLKYRHFIQLLELRIERWIRQLESMQAKSNESLPEVEVSTPEVLNLETTSDDVSIVIESSENAADDLEIADSEIVLEGEQIIPDPEENSKNSLEVATLEDNSNPLPEVESVEATPIIQASCELENEAPAVPVKAETSIPFDPKKKGALRLKVDQIPLIDIAEKYGWLTGKKRPGTNTLPCPLPEHGHIGNDRKKRGHHGSFTIDTRANQAACWKCGKYFFDGPSLLAAVRGERKQRVATLIIAKDFGIITEDAYEKGLSGLSIRTEEIQESSLFVPHDGMDFFEDRAPDEILDKVYRCLATTYRAANFKKLKSEYGLLSEADYEYLRTTRGMSVNSIRKGFYFTFPEDYHFEEFVNALIFNKIIADESELSQILKGVPGFYYSKKRQKWSYATVQKENGNFTLRGIAIPIRNAKGLIVGIQIRNSDKNCTLRYTWLSSKYFVEGDYEFGITPGSRLDVVVPEKITSKVLFITEGRFKAQVIAETFNCVAISVQGVACYDGIQEEIKTLIEERGLDFEEIYLAYDADMSYKYEVFIQSKNLCVLLEEYFPAISISYVGWDVQYGKGIDDLIQGGHQDRLSKLQRETFEALCTKCHKQMKEIECEWEESDYINYYNQHVLVKFPKYEKLHLKQAQ